MKAKQTTIWLVLLWCASAVQAESGPIMDENSAAKLKAYFAAEIAKDPEVAPALKVVQQPIEDLVNSCNNVAVQQKKVDTVVLMQPSNNVTKATLSTLANDAKEANEAVRLAIKRTTEFSITVKNVFEKSGRKNYRPEEFAQKMLLGSRKKGCDMKFLEMSIPFFNKIIEVSELLVANWETVRVEEGQFTLQSEDLQSRVDAAREEIYRLENERYEYSIALRKSLTEK